MLRKRIGQAYKNSGICKLYNMLNISKNVFEKGDNPVTTVHRLCLTHSMYEDIFQNTIIYTWSEVNFHGTVLVMLISNLIGGVWI